MKYRRFRGYKEGERVTILITDSTETLEWVMRMMDRVEFLPIKVKR